MTIGAIKRALSRKWVLALKVLPFLLVVIVSKLIAHSLKVEFLSLSPLLTAVISASIFLMGFLLSGVVTDYKESEKLPGDLAASLETIVDECSIIYKNKGSEAANECLKYVHDLADSIINWFYKKEKTASLYDKISGLNDYFLAFEPLTQANFIARLKQEQSAIRRLITRIHTIRETSFVEAGYAIVELITFILVFGLVFVRIDPYYESVFFVGFVSFVLIYMILLIRDVDNPYDYYEAEQLTGEVSLKPLLDLQERIDKVLMLPV